MTKSWRTTKSSRKSGNLKKEKRTLSERRAQIRAKQAEEPNIVDLVEVVNGGQEDEEDEEDGELAEENQEANADN